MEQLRGRVAVVTGAGDGIGRALSITLAREGMDVALADLRGEAAERVAREVRAEGRRALPIAVDVGDEAAMHALAERVYAELGAVHLLCNNAGVVGPASLQDADDRNWRWLVQVNLFGVVHGVQSFLPRMLDGGDEGHIVNTASSAGLVAGGGPGSSGPSAARSAGYAASKHGVVALTEVLYSQLAGSRIGASVLCPHTTRTDLFHNASQLRPAQYGGPLRSPGTLAELERTGRLWPGLMDPFEVARRVVTGVRRGRLYIITHPELRGAVEQRFQRLLAALDDAAADDGEATGPAAGE